MAALLLTEQYFDDVVVLHLRGKISIGEGSVTVRSAVRDLLEKGQRKFVLNFAGVGYVDSSGNGEMVSSYTAILKEGGQIAFCHLSQKVQDLWTINKLLTVFDVYEDVAGAVAALSSPRKLFRCPLPRCNSRVAVLQVPGNTISPICGACHTRFEMTVSAIDTSEGTIGSLSMPTYQDEYIRTAFGSPTVIEIVGRLDLFACDVLRKTWQIIPAPRRVIFNIDQATEITQHGGEVLQELCLSDEVDAMAVILSGSAQSLDLFKVSVRVYHNREAALAAFGRSDKEAAFIVHLRQGPTG